MRFLDGVHQTTQVVRAAIIVVMAPLLRRTGYGLNWREGVVLWWSGLRGAVGLALSLYLLLDDLIPDLRYRTVCFLFMGMMAVRGPRLPAAASCGARRYRGSSIRPPHDKILELVSAAAVG